MADLLQWETSETTEEEEEKPIAATVHDLPKGVMADGRPNPQWVRGRCPECGDDLVSNLYYVSGQYLIAWECWASLSENPTCQYRQIL